MSFRTSCRRASELLSSQACLEKAAQHPSGLRRQYSSCTTGAPSSSLEASASSSSSAPRRTPRRRLTENFQVHQQAKSVLSLAQSTPSARAQSLQSTPLRAPFSSSCSTSSPSDSRPGSSLTPQTTTEEVRAWFEEHYGEFKLPDGMLLQFITHESWDNGTGATGHNRRLSFLGRRAMNMFMSLFLHLNVAGTSSSSGAVREGVSRLLSATEEVEAVLQTSRLGDGVGRALKLEEVMRWQPAVSDGQVGPKETGLFKIRGVTVEAFVGALYHQHGAAVARAFFDSRILPNLESFPADAKKELGTAIEAAAANGESVLATLSQQETTSQANERVTLESRQDTRRVSSVVDASLGATDGSSQRREHSASV